MTNDEVILLFIGKKVGQARNGRGHLVFSGGVLRSYQDVIGMWLHDTLLISSEIFSATSSRHQSTLKKYANGAVKYKCVPDLSALVDIRDSRDIGEVRRYLSRRRAAINEHLRKIKDTPSSNVRASRLRMIEIEKTGARIAISHLPFADAAAEYSRFFPAVFSGEG